MAIESYEKISELIEQPLHLGITESGSLKTGTVKSSIGLGIFIDARYWRYYQGVFSF